MKSASIMLLALSATSCSAESSHVRQARDRFFSAVARFDYSAVRAAVTSGCVLIEGGRILSVDTLVGDMQRFEADSGRMRYAFDDSILRVEPPVAWMTYRVRRILARSHRVDTVHSVESAVFRRDGGGWKLALLHSTPQAAAGP